MKQTFLLIAPYYFFASLLIGVFTIILFVGIWPLAFVPLLGFAFAINRAMKWLQIRNDELTIRNAFGWNLLTLNSRHDVANLRLSKKADLAFQGPLIPESTAFRRALGWMLRLFEFLFFSFAVTSSVSSEDFVVLTYDDIRTNSAKFILLPDVYGWNQRPYRIMHQWLQIHAYPLALDQAIDWSDEGTNITGYIYIFLAAGILGIFCFIYFYT